MAKKKKLKKDSDEFQKYMDNIYSKMDNAFSTCLHDSCPECHGKGIKEDGRICIHFISCNCPKCSVNY